jgi:hypothetical protein
MFFFYQRLYHLKIISFKDSLKNEISKRKLKKSNLTKESFNYLNYSTNKFNIPYFLWELSLYLLDWNIIKFIKNVDPTQKNKKNHWIIDFSIDLII